jgi:CDP-diacylglycerol--glycerol-3-phosphate 3-phosphatidyltransferase
MNLPNLLTLTRLFLVPFLVLFFYIPYFRTLEGSIFLGLLFIVASLTDVADGYLARKRSQVTSLGKFLDPVADKVLVISVLILLVGENRVPRVPAWIAVIIIGREFVVNGLRMIAALDGILIAAERFGKYKMILQSTAIVFLVLVVDPRFYFYEIGVTLLLLSMTFSLLSAGQYFLKFGQQLKLMKAS